MSSDSEHSGGADRADAARIPAIPETAIVEVKCDADTVHFVYGRLREKDGSKKLMKRVKKAWHDLADEWEKRVPVIVVYAPHTSPLALAAAASYIRFGNFHDAPDERAFVNENVGTSLKRLGFAFIYNKWRLNTADGAQEDAATKRAEAERLMREARKAQRRGERYKQRKKSLYLSDESDYSDAEDGPFLLEAGNVPRYALGVNGGIYDELD